MNEPQLKRLHFPLFQTPLDLAHAYWERILNLETDSRIKPGTSVIDATCGNGHDTLFLAKTMLNQKSHQTLIAIDKQQQAIENTQILLKKEFSEKKLTRIYFHQRCHSSFPPDITQGSVSLVVYNLGYLPGGNKQLTTESSTTLQSLKAALHLINSGGAISLTCYPGHPAGQLEEELLLDFTATLDPHLWSCCYHRWTNRQNAPSLLFIQKGIDIFRHCP